MIGVETDFKNKELLYTSVTTNVSRCQDENGRSLIIKSLNEPFPTVEQVARFTFAFDIQKKFKHENIVEIESLIKVGNTPTVVMLDEGLVSLHEYLDELPHHCLPIETFLPFALQLCRAIGEIHHRKIIHKDLHAGNVLIHPTTLHVKITDFGLASMLPREQPSLKPPDQIEGILAYISPEQTGRMNRALDYRTDFYSMGVLFYFALTGRLPFQSDDGIGMVHAHIAHIAKPVCQINPAVPKVVSDIVAKLMAKNAEDRYQSSEGVHSDLIRCQKIWQTAGEVPEFALAEQDISDHFSIPQKLYGREQEIEELWAAFRRACEGRPVMLSLSGYSGVGKSALIHEVHKPIAADDALFISGKFDQLQHNIPYSALLRALSEWVQQVLTESESRLQHLKQILLQRLGQNARVLIDFLQEMELVLGALPPVAELGAEETRNRFHHTFSKFMQCASEAKPLVVFIDDVQWADLGTLQLLKAIMMNGEGRILLLLAYRDNEVDANHALNEVFTSVSRLHGGNLCQLRLKPLSFTHLQKLLKETLDTDKGVSELASLILTKTEGNPFFVNEFLKSLYTESLIDFDQTNRCWYWDLEQIRAKGITDNVVELMLDKMKKMPVATQQMLQKAACIGSRFDIQTLAVITELDGQTVSQLLWPALTAGLLVQEGGDWLPGIVSERQSEKCVSTYLPANVPSCRFLHDRMLQAAYSSLSEKEKSFTHLSIGRLLHSHNPSPKGTEVFSQAEQFNAGKALILPQQEKCLVAELNYQAAMNAKQASVWRAAFQFVSTALSLLPLRAWELQYELTKKVTVLFVECAYLDSKPALAFEFAEYALNQLKENEDKAQLCLLTLTHGGRFQNMGGIIDKGIEGLKYCGIEIPRSNDDIIELVNIFETEIQHYFDCRAGSLLAEMDGDINQQQDFQLSLMSSLSGVCYVAKQPLLNKLFSLYAMKLLLEFGGGSQSPVILARYALVSSHDRLDLATKLSQKALDILDQQPGHPELSNASITIGSMVWHFTHPYSETLSILSNGFREGLANGSILMGVGCFSNSIILRFSRGESLSSINRELERLKELLLKYQQPISAGIQYQRLLDMLRGNTKANTLSEAEFLPAEWTFVKESSIYAFILHLRLLWLFWSDPSRINWAEVERAQDALLTIPGMLPNIDHFFIKGLLISRFSSEFSESESDKRIHELYKIVEKFSYLSSQCAENFKHKLVLLQAEYTRVVKPELSMFELYKQAINLAVQGDFLQDAALAYELYGECAMVYGFAETGWASIQQAHYMYGQWGAVIRQKRLEEKYPNIFQSTVSARVLTSASSHRVSGSGRIADSLDIETILKSSQTISSEIILDQLMAKIMEIILENAGAQSGVMLLESNSVFAVEFVATTTISGNYVESGSLRPPVPLDEFDQLPHELIRLVLRTDKSVVLQNVEHDPKWSQDAYFEQKSPKSVLCTPIHYREKLTGVLYLENMLTVDAFTSERLSVLEMLLVQVAISLENARLFDEVQTLNLSLEDKVEQRTSELKAVNKELEAFSYSVSHDLRAPLRSIKGFAEALLEDYEDKLDGMGQDMLRRVCAGAEKMSDLIHGLLELSRLTRSELILSEVCLSDLVNEIAIELRERFPQQNVQLLVGPDIVVQGDKRMLYSVIENLISNAWKYSSKKEVSEIEFGVISEKNQPTYFIRDNGAGFDMKYAHKLFDSFQRLHTNREFEGTGVGLATVQRIVHRHHGEIWAKSELGVGATFYFTLGC
ncbi:AAA family ATPase [Oleiphilus messinensis]|uniref:AAA family ATPase n=1 Tax=Oleiphilus messinensis TaxID=141451 RepID=UPI0018E02729|nr:AAA family ATPase [Oleiphilus messinensis]